MIIAKDEDEKLFGRECRANDLFCELAHSTVVWKKDIIRSCNLELVTAIANMTAVAKDVVFQAEKQWAFQLVGDELMCKSEGDEGIRVVKTS